MYLNNYILSGLQDIYKNDDMKISSEDELVDKNKCKFYETGNYYVPRVTTLLDTIKEDYLLQWANSLGWKRMSYTKTLQEYADIGTLVHEEIEKFLKEGKLGVSPGFLSFKEWWEQLNAINNITDIESEVSMICPYFCGTTDLYFKANGHDCLVDFKTSKHISYKYIMQLAAYVYMMNYIYHRNIKYCIIFQVDKYTPYQYKAYVYDLHDFQVSDMFNYGLAYIMNLAIGYLYNHRMREMFEKTEQGVITNGGIKLK